MHLLLIALMIAVPSFGAEITADNFDNGISHWTSGLTYGKVDQCKSSAGVGVAGSGALQIDYKLEDSGTNHILYTAEIPGGIVGAETIAFDVKGIGKPASIFLFAIDSEEKYANFGPHGTNYDFTTGYEDWHTCRLRLEVDQPVGGNEPDLTDIRKIGFFIWSMGPVEGTVWIDNLRYTETGNDLRLNLQSISPNGDGVQDAVDIKTVVPVGSQATIQVLNPYGHEITRLVDDLLPQKPVLKLTWDGLVQGKPVPAGLYTLRAMYRGANTTEARTEVRVVDRKPWPEISYKAEPFVPVGVWFEGAPSFTGCPADPVAARGWFDRAFTDLSSNGFNAIAVPNCPDTLWDPLLRSAEDHGIKVALEIGPLVNLVSRADKPSEEEVEAVCQAMVDRMKVYPALVRYQIRDEPPVSMVDNWILVQRILAALDPTRPSFSCFCSYDSLGYVAQKTTLSEAVYDIYPLTRNTPLQTLGSFEIVLEYFKQNSHGLPMWGVAQAFAVNGPQWRYPTPEELRAKTYLWLAAGAKGIYYFIYNHMPGYLDGLVSSDGTPQPLYAPTAKLAQELKQLSPMLLTLKPGDEISVSGDAARVGSFLTPENKQVLIIASRTPGAAQTANVNVAGTWVDALSGAVLNSNAGVLSVELEAGGGRVLVERE